MFRATIAKTALRTHPSVALSQRAAFTTTLRAMAEGDVGAPPKAGGSGDAFQKRERASEDLAIRRREREKLLELKKKVSEQQAHLKQLSDHIDEITKDQGGEHN